MTSSPERDGACFYTVANSGHFLGAVGLLNSVRLAGHTEPFVLVDAGLTRDQRKLVAGSAELVTAPPDVPPVHLAPYAPLLRPASVQVVLDADLIMTRAVTELVDSAARGHVVGMVNDPPNHDRHFEEWATTLGLPPLRRRPYLNAGHFFFPSSLNDRLLTPWIDGQRQLGLAGSRYARRARLGDPFYFADQDVVNAVFSAYLDDDELDVRPHALAPHPPFSGVRLSSRPGLLCERDTGEPPYFLHHTMAKPWLAPTRHSVYATLLTRLLLEPDVEVRLRPADLPARLRPGAWGRVDRHRSHMQAVAVATARRRFGTFGIRTRWEDWRRRPPARER